MCGIAGFIGRARVSEEAIRSTLSLMRNRGPDHRDSFSLAHGARNVHLLHSRLSIIDLDDRSNQPFEKAHCVLAFNGEIYNYIELRQALEKDGIVFATDSDTEVLITYYLRYGERCVDYFEGMWAFAIYDRKEEKLFLSRDRFGEKPLYVYQDDRGLYFGSETKLLRSLSERDFDVDYEHLKRYLVNGSKSLHKSNASFYHGIKEVPFATNLVVGGGGSVREAVFWRPTFQPRQMSEAEAVEGVRHHLTESLKLRLRSDVPLAFCLSGGVDSSSLVSIAAKVLGASVTTFSILDSDERYDERDNIAVTVEDLGCENIQIQLDPAADNLTRLEELIAYHDAPVATISYFVHSMLSEAISEGGFKISISGTGADEIFTGYYDHYNLHFYEMRDHPQFETLLADWRRHQQPHVRHPGFKKPDLYFDDPTIRDHIYLNSEEFSTYLKQDFNEPFSETQYTDSLLRNRMLNEFFHEVVRAILHEDDLNSMKYSVENRSPFLDRGLFEFMYSVQNELLIKDGYAKYLLRASMKGILNDTVRLEREKKGFNASINSIIDLNDPLHVQSILENSRIYDVVDRKKIEALLKKKVYPNSFKKFLFNFINAKIFLG